MSTTDEYTSPLPNYSSKKDLELYYGNKEYTPAWQLKKVGWRRSKPLNDQNCNTCLQSCRCPLAITGWGIFQANCAKEEVKKWGMCSKYEADSYKTSIFQFLAKKFNIPVTSRKWYNVKSDMELCVKYNRPIPPELLEMYNMLIKADPSEVIKTEEEKERERKERENKRPHDSMPLNIISRGMD